MCESYVTWTKDYTHDNMVCSAEMVSLIRNLLFREVGGDGNCYTRCLYYVVSIARVSGTRKVSFSVKVLCR